MARIIHNRNYKKYIEIAKLDITDNKDLADKYKVIPSEHKMFNHHIPTLKYYEKGIEIPFTADNTEN